MKSKKFAVKLNAVLKNKADNSSTEKYWIENFFLQNLHLNFKIKDEIKGILSNHLILFLHRGQKDLLDTISKFFGNRYIQTFKKLPITAPIINKKKKLFKSKLNFYLCSDFYHLFNNII